MAYIKYSIDCYGGYETVPAITRVTEDGGEVQCPACGKWVKFFTGEVNCPYCHVQLAEGNNDNV